MLEDAKKKSADEVNEKVTIATKTENKFREICENYRSSANRCALAFLSMMDKCKIHSLDKYSLDVFLVVVTRSIGSVMLRTPTPLKEEKATESACC